MAFNFTNFYIKYDIDKNKLVRDYELNPLKLNLTDIYNSKTGKLNSRRYILENPVKEDFEYLYIDRNVPMQVLMEYFNISRNIFGKIKRIFKIKKEQSSALKNTSAYYVDNFGCLSYSGTTEFKKRYTETSLKKYGVHHPALSPEIKKRIEDNNIKKYGVRFYVQSNDHHEKMKQTNLKKYGVENPFSSEMIQEKIKITNKQRYGVENPSQNENIKHKKEVTTFEHYGVTNPSCCREVIDKIFKTRKNNNTLTSSSFEEKVNILLKKKFNNINRNYKSELYPFACDFYIDDIALYIELQGHYSHGKEPYDCNNTKHQEIVKKWQQRAKTIKEMNNIKKSQYDDCIDVWTRRDPLKREIAKKNNLNWIEFFTLDEFMNWYNKI